MNKEKRVDEDFVRQMKFDLDNIDGGYSRKPYYDKQGNHISSFEWTSLFAMNDYKIVERTELKNGYLISTIWLGLDHSWGSKIGYPIIFETMVFPGNEMQRYSTLEQAIKGHKEMVKEWSRKRKIKK